MEKPTLSDFHKALYSAHPGISFETAEILYNEKFKVAEAAPEVQTKKTKKKK